MGFLWKTKNVPGCMHFADTGFRVWRLSERSHPPEAGVSVGRPQAPPLWSSWALAGPDRAASTPRALGWHPVT